MNESEEISWLPLILVAFATFIITLDSTFMNVSISQLIIDLNTSLSTIQLIISFYALTTASLMLLSSKLQDILGKKKIFLIGALLFGIGALIASISFNSIMLFIGWSLLEGVGGALMTPATISIISSTYVNDRRTRALAVLSAMGGIAAAIGPIFGGFITTFISWRAGFVFELAIIVFIFAYSSRIKDFRPMAKTNLDIVGAVMSILGLVFFVLGILNLKSNLILSFLLIVIAIAVFYFFVRYEIKFKQAGLDPLVDIGLLKDYNLKIGMISRLLLMMVMIGSLFAVSVFLQGVLGFSAIVTGLCLIPATGGILISAILVPKLSKKYDSIFLMVLGCILAIIACIVLRNQFNIYAGFWSIAPGMLIYGLGLGLALSLGIDVSISNIPNEKQSTASGLLTTSQTLGNSIGVAIVGCLLIMGALGGLSNAIDIYDPSLDFDNLDIGSGVYIEKLGHVEISDFREHEVKENIVNFVLSSAMKMVWDFSAIVLFIAMILTLSLDDRIPIVRGVRQGISKRRMKPQRLKSGQNLLR